MKESRWWPFASLQGGESFHGSVTASIGIRPVSYTHLDVYKRQGIASALAMALGGNIYRRLGVCEAPACDRVYVDASKNSHKRFCSTRCQSRVKAAAHRARR